MNNIHYLLFEANFGLEVCQTPKGRPFEKACVHFTVSIRLCCTVLYCTIHVYCTVLYCKKYSEWYSVMFCVLGNFDMTVLYSTVL